MNKNLLIALMVILSSCTFTKQQKAEKLVKLLLDSTLYDPSSYQSIKFSKLDTVFTRYVDTKEAKLVALTVDSLSLLDSLTMDKLKEADTDPDKYTIAEFDRIYNERQKYSKEELDILAKEVIKEKHFKSQFNGWKLVHDYRGKNKFGALIINSTEFRFDKDVTKIIAVKNLN